MEKYEDFQEIGHCGGKITFDIECDEAGRRSYTVGIEGRSPGPAAWVGIYAAPPAIPVTDFQIGGIGQGFQRASSPDEAKRNPGFAHTADPRPDYASLHPGYACCLAGRSPPTRYGRLAGRRSSTGHGPVSRRSTPICAAI